MSVVTRLMSLVTRLPTILRTVRHIRPAQARAQAQHMLSGIPTAPVATGPAPHLAIRTPATSFLPPASHVEIRGEADGRILRLLGLDQPLPDSGVEWAAAPHGPLVAYHLHEQAYLRHEALSPDARAMVIEDWIARHPAGVGWDPHPISLRLMSWGKLLLTEGALPFGWGGDAGDPRGEVLLRSMANQAEALAGSLEVRLQANHLLSNLLGVVWAGLILEGGRAETWRAHSDAFCDELDAQVARDGGHEERSPMYHSLILENLLDLVNVARVSPRAPADLLGRIEGGASRMLDALAVYAGPDGRIALLADSAWGVAAEPALLFDYAARLSLSGGGTTPRSARLSDTGYVRIVAGEFDLIASLSGPAPAHQPGHAHCDALAFELCVAGRRLVTDTGVFEYRPGPRRDIARATASHATLQFDGAEQSETWAAHRIGGRCRVEVTHDLANGELAAMAIGWKRGAPRHRRHFHVDSGGVSIRDVVDTSDGDHEVESRLPIDPDWTLEGSEEGVVASHAESGARVRIHLPGELEWQIERGPFYPTFHVETERCVLVGRGRTPIDSLIRFEHVY